MAKKRQKKITKQLAVDQRFDTLKFIGELKHSPKMQKAFEDKMLFVQKKVESFWPYLAKLSVEDREEVTSLAELSSQGLQILAKIKNDISEN